MIIFNHIMLTRKCLNKNCNNVFSPYKGNHLFCSRKCFIEWYRKQKKDTYPLFICPNCHRETFLNFSPIKQPKKWAYFMCPFCGSGQEKVREYKIVQKIKIKFAMEI